MDKIKQIFNKELINVHGAAYLLALSSALSVLLALLRDRLLVSFVGPGYELDIYYASFKIPDLLFAAIASFVSAFVLIPFLSYKNEKDSYKFLSEVTSSFVIVSVFFVFVLFVFAHFVLSAIFPDLYIADSEQFTFAFRVLLFQFLILGLSSAFSAFLQAKHKFVIYALAPIIYNLSIIMSLFLYPKYHIKALVAGVLVGAVLHMLSFAVFLDLSQLRFKFALKPFANLIKLAWPRTASLFVAQLSLLYIFHELSKIREGSVSAFQLASNLQAAPLSVIAASYSVAAFPSLSKLYSRKEYKEFAKKLSLAVRHMLLWATAFAFLAIVLRAHIVRIVFGTENFTWGHTIFVSAIFSVLVASLVFQSLNIIFARALYAARIYIPAIVISLSNFISLFLLSKFLIYKAESFRFLMDLFNLSSEFELKVLLISIAFLLANFVAFLFSAYYLSSEFGDFCASDILKSSLQFLAAAFFAFLLTKYMLYISSPFFPLDTFFNLLLQTILGATLFAVVYIAILRIFSNLELLETWRILKSQTIEKW